MMMDVSWMKLSRRTAQSSSSHAGVHDTVVVGRPLVVAEDDDVACHYDDYGDV